MPSLIQIQSADRKLLRSVERAFAGAARRSGDWLVCREGCSQCCTGVFAISQLDAERLREGMKRLGIDDPKCAGRIRRRARSAVKRLTPGFPGDIQTGVLGESDEQQQQFEDFGNDERCPALDPKTRRCEIYESRPMTCRVFGPPVRSEGGLGCCELCYHEATPEQVAACEMKIDVAAEEALNLKLEQSIGRTGQTLVALVLAE